MNTKALIISITAVALSFLGGFFIANALNRAEMEGLKKENERLTGIAKEAEQRSTEGTLTNEEIRAKIDEADKNPDNVKFNTDLGIALYRYAAMKKDVELLGESGRILERVSAKEPKNADVLVTLGNAKFDIANFGNQNALFAEARSIYEKVVPLRPDDANVQTDIALTYFLTQPPNLEKAVAAFEKAVAKDPKNERAIQFMIQTQWQKGDLENAMVTLEKLKTVNNLNPAIPELTTLLTRTPPTQ